MAHQMNAASYKTGSFLPNKIGELAAALHTCVSCRALRKYIKKVRFDSVTAHGLFIHRAMGTIHMTVTISKTAPIEITAKQLVDGMLSPDLFVL